MQNTDIAKVAPNPTNDKLTRTRALVLAEVERSDLVSVADAPMLVDVLTLYKASFSTMLKLIEEFGLKARDVALLYEARENCEEGVTLAAIARAGSIFPELMAYDSDQLATEINEALRVVWGRWPRRTLYPTTILKMIHGVVERSDDPLSFAQAVETLIEADEHPDRDE